MSKELKLTNIVVGQREENTWRLFRKGHWVGRRERSVSFNFITTYSLLNHCLATAPSEFRSLTRGPPRHLCCLSDNPGSGIDVIWLPSCLRVFNSAFNLPFRSSVRLLNRPCQRLSYWSHTRSPTKNKKQLCMGNAWDCRSRYCSPYECTNLIVTNLDFSRGCAFLLTPRQAPFWRVFHL